MRVRALTVAALVAALAAVPAGAKSQRALRAFASCDQLLHYARAHGQTAVGTGWLPTPFVAQGAPPNRVPTSKGGPPKAAPQAAAEDSAGGATTEFSTTNVQEQGVDEPDIVKTDGNVIFAVVNGVLHSVDVSGEEPKLVDTLELDAGYGHELLLHGDRLLVVQNAWLEPDPGEPAELGRPVTRLTEVDVSDPSDLKVLRNERDDGEYVSARMTGDTVRIVLASRPPILFAVAETAASAGKPAARASAKRGAIAKRQRQVRRAKLAAWQPHTFFRDHKRPKRPRFHALTRCNQVRHTARFSGLDTITILTVDMAKGLPSVDADALFSDAQIVYGSPDRLYVATQRWLSPQTLQRPEPPATVTQIHAFDTSAADTTSYVASGQVGGYLLNQFAMSQYRGVLRVASTETPQWWSSAPPDEQPGSAVTTLDMDTMSQLGRIGGLGKGERIYAVRFIDDTAYVVTFRQIDPLYTVDLSQPSNPIVAGELKVAGYSAYLHPIGKDLLLGVGQDAGEDGRTNGTQVSLFDVSDPAKPTRLAKYAVGQYSSSTAEFDHHAFLYWPKTKLVVIPVALYDYVDGQSDPFVGAIGLHVDRDSIDEVGRVAHPHDDYSLWTIERATVVGERLFTTSAAGILASKLSDLSPGPFVAFPDAPTSYGCGGPYVSSEGGTTSDAAVSCPASAR